MSQAKRARIEANEADAPPGCSENAVCDPCRLKKIRCGRERPYCGNCARLGLDCSWSGQGKKPNQVVALHHAVNDLSSRMWRLETGIDGIQQMLQQLRGGSACGGSEKSWSADKTLFSVSPALSRQPWYSGRRPGLRQLFVRGNGLEQCMGPVSLDALVHDVKEFELDPRCAGGNGLSPASPAAILARDKLSALLLKPGEEQSTGITTGLLPDDHLTLAMPPVSIMETMMETYFESINPRLPIWTRSGSRRLVEACRDPGGQDANQGVAYAVCCNNIIVLTLSAQSLASRSRQSRCQSPLQSSSAKEPPRRRSVVELDLTKAFVANAKRTLKSLNELLSPSVVNLQSLLSLCLVAYQYFSEDVVRLVFHHASYLALTIGIYPHQLAGTGVADVEGLELENLEERRQLAYCMCVISSSMSWPTGIPPTVWDDITAVRGPLVSPETASAVFGDSRLDSDNCWASLKLALIQHRTFSVLHSTARADGAPGLDVQQIICTLRQDHQSWYSEYVEGCPTPISAGLVAATADVTKSVLGNDLKLGHRGATMIHTERAIRSCNTKVLLAWLMPDELREVHDVLKESRECLRLWSSALDTDCADVGHFAMLARLLTCHPPAAFIQLLIHVVNDVDDNSIANDGDVQLLKSFARVTQLVAGSSEPGSHAARLAAITAVLADFAAAYRRDSVPTSRMSPYPVASSGASSNITEDALRLVGMDTECDDGGMERSEQRGLQSLGIDCDDILASTSLGSHFDMVDMNPDLFVGYMRAN